MENRLDYWLSWFEWVEIRSTTRFPFHQNTRLCHSYSARSSENSRVDNIAYWLIFTLASGEKSTQSSYCHSTFVDELDNFIRVSITGIMGQGLLNPFLLLRKQCSDLSSRWHCQSYVQRQSSRDREHCLATRYAGRTWKKKSSELTTFQPSKLSNAYQ